MLSQEKARAKKIKGNDGASWTFGKTKVAPSRNLSWLRRNRTATARVFHRVREAMQRRCVGRSGSSGLSRQTGEIPVALTQVLAPGAKSRRYVRHRTYAIENFAYWFKRVQV